MLLWSPWRRLLPSEPAQSQTEEPSDKRGARERQPWAFSGTSHTDPSSCSWNESWDSAGWSVEGTRAWGRGAWTPSGAGYAPGAEARGGEGSVSD